MCGDDVVGHINSDGSREDAAIDMNRVGVLTDELSMTSQRFVFDSRFQQFSMIDLRDLTYGTMGEWLMIPETEEMIVVRINRFKYRRGRREKGPSRFHDLRVYFDGNDIANLADVSDEPLWECEVPLTDDGF